MTKSVSKVEWKWTNFFKRPINAFLNHHSISQLCRIIYFNPYLLENSAKIKVNILNKLSNCNLNNFNKILFSLKVLSSHFQKNMKILISLLKIILYILFIDQLAMDHRGDYKLISIEKLVYAHKPAF